MNPARSIGPALISGHWEYYWIYLLAPILGMIISYNIWNKINNRI
jgi:aquaporin Z